MLNQEHRQGRRGVHETELIPLKSEASHDIPGEKGSLPQWKPACRENLSYTVNDAAAVDHLKALGTDSIITDQVDLLAVTGRPVGWSLPCVSGAQAWPLCWES